MHFFPVTIANLYEALAATTVSGSALINADDEAYLMWAQATANYAMRTNSPGLPTVNFWLVVQLEVKGFSGNLEMHKTLPMMIPKDGIGKLIGIARSQEELDTLVGVEPDKYVYLTYKIKLQGQNAWLTLLEFLGEHDMLSKDN